ncbi:MAG: LysM peptidoglycan-binding domain-containing protein [Actinomycetota bacterium]|nr:LysM peptidoglycan-binding domain-containing protein [Actinomycetota bacterium]
MASTPTVFQAAGAPAAGAAGGQPGGAPSNLVHAFLEILKPPPSGTTDAPATPTGERVAFQFNPKELTLTKTAKWKREPAKGAKKSGVPEFLGAEPAKMSVEMFLDATRKMDDSVVKAVEKLFGCCVPAAGTPEKQKASPPWVRFHWGPVTGFPGHIKSVTVKYTLFASSGLPIRALCTVQLEEMGGETSGQNPTSGALAARAVRTVVDGDSLASVAYREYGDPTWWRALAEANDIDDPMRLPVGRALLVPAMEELNGA